MKRVLLDHCVPYPLKLVLKGHSVRSAGEEGWEQLSNGALLNAAEAASFEVLITSDKNLRYQQNLSTRKIAIIELPTNRLRVVAMLAPAVLKAIEQIVASQYVILPMPS